MNVNDFNGLPEHVLHDFACDCAWRALEQEREAGREPDPRSWEAVRVKRRWVEGKATSEELDSAAWSAASRAACGAAYSAAWSAASRSAWSAAWSTADRAEESWQRAHLASLLDQYQQERISLVQALMGRALQLQAQRAPVQLWQQETDEGLF